MPKVYCQNFLSSSKLKSRQNTNRSYISRDISCMPVLLFIRPLRSALRSFLIAHCVLITKLIEAYLPLSNDTTTHLPLEWNCYNCVNILIKKISLYWCQLYVISIISAQLIESQQGFLLYITTKWASCHYQDEQWPTFMTPRNVTKAQWFTFFSANKIHGHYETVNFLLRLCMSSSNREQHISKRMVWNVSYFWIIQHIKRRALCKWKSTC